MGTKPEVKPTIHDELSNRLSSTLVFELIFVGILCILVYWIGYTSGSIDTRNEMNRAAIEKLKEDVSDIKPHDPFGSLRISDSTWVDTDGFLKFLIPCIQEWRESDTHSPDTLMIPDEYRFDDTIMQSSHGFAE